MKSLIYKRKYQWTKKCKCAQNRVKVRKGDIIKGEILVSKSNEKQQLDSFHELQKLYSFYTSTFIRINICKLHFSSFKPNCNLYSRNQRSYCLKQLYKEELPIITCEQIIKLSPSDIDHRISVWIWGSPFGFCKNEWLPSFFQNFLLPFVSFAITSIFWKQSAKTSITCNEAVNLVISLRSFFYSSRN